MWVYQNEWWLTDEIFEIVNKENKRIVKICQ
jgi:hypothetical protein